MLSVLGERIWKTINIKRDGWAILGNIFVKSYEIHMKNKFLKWQETLSNDTLQTAARSGLKDKLQAKVQVILCWYLRETWKVYRTSCFQCWLCHLYEWQSRQA